MMKTEPFDISTSFGIDPGRTPSTPRDAFGEYR